MTRPAKIALAIFLVSFVGFVTVCVVSPPTSLKWLFFILEHAFEGAMVGCICDFIAVKQVYTKAEEKYESLSAGVSNTVVRKMIRLEELLQSSKQLDTWLESEENVLSLQQKLHEVVPSEHELESFLYNMWDHRIHEPLIVWLTEADPRTIMHTSLTKDEDIDESEQILAVFDHPEIRHALALCMQEVADNEELATESMDKLRNVAGNLRNCMVRPPNSVQV